jgi:biofilm protein TabA
MIVDRLDYANLYVNLSSGITRGFEYLRTTDLQHLPLGRVEIDGESLFAIVVDEPTRSINDCKWESHQRYYDIQYVVDGEELMGFASLDQMCVVEPFENGSDYAFYEGDGQYIAVRAGWFALFAPQDVHRPSIAIERPSRVRKVVIKVKV